MNWNALTGLGSLLTTVNTVKTIDSAAAAPMKSCAYPVWHIGRSSVTQENRRLDKFILVGKV